MGDLDRYHGTGDLLVRLWRDARKEVIKDKYKAFMELEATARMMWLFQLRVPGLLQTEDYARAVLSGARATHDSTPSTGESTRWTNVRGPSSLPRRLTCRAFSTQR